VQQLRHDQVGDVVVDWLAEEDDPLVQQARVDVERALAARALLDDHRDEGHGGILSTTAWLSFHSSNHLVVKGGLGHAHAP